MFDPGDPPAPGGAVRVPEASVPASLVPESRWRAILVGALGFMGVSVAAFAVWAFGGGWFRGRGGEPAMYAVITVVFLGLGGVVLQSLLRGPRRLTRFYGAFVPAFLAYAVVWSVFWFWLGGGAGEWLGAILGCLVFVAISALRLGRPPGQGLLLAGVVFFVAHTAGYFAGGRAMAHFMGAARQAPARSDERARWSRMAKLSWGVCYGLGFGAGLGCLYPVLQRAPRKSQMP